MNRAGYIVIKLQPKSVTAAQALSLFMDEFAESNGTPARTPPPVAAARLTDCVVCAEVVGHYGLERVRDFWNVCPDNGFMYCVFRPPWVTADPPQPPPTWHPVSVDELTGQLPPDADRTNDHTAGDDRSPPPPPPPRPQEHRGEDDGHQQERWQAEAAPSSWTVRVGDSVAEPSPLPPPPRMSAGNGAEDDSLRLDSSDLDGGDRRRWPHDDDDDDDEYPTALSPPSSPPSSQPLVLTAERPSLSEASGDVPHSTSQPQSSQPPQPASVSSQRAVAFADELPSPLVKSDTHTSFTSQHYEDDFED